MSNDGTTVTMTKERETKGTYVYSAPKGSPVDTLYVRKDALGGDAPEKINVIIRPA